MSSTNKIEISTAEESDLECILALQKQAYHQEAEIYNDFTIPPLLQAIGDLRAEWQQGVVLKAVKNNEIVGSVRAVRDGDICRIGKLIVKPSAQNMGLGKKLMKTVEKVFENCFTYELFTGDKSEKNLALYRKLGYRQVRKEELGNNLTLVYLQKRKD